MLTAAALALTLSAPAEPVFIASTRADNKLIVFKAADLSEIKTIDAGLGAHEIGVSPDNRWAIGSAYGGPGKGHQPPDKRVAIVDLAAMKLHKTVDLGELRRPNDIAFLPGPAPEAIITVEDLPHLVRLNAQTGDFTTIKLEHKAGHMMALAPDGKTAFVSHVVPGSVSFVDLADGVLSRSVNVAQGAEGIACSPDGKSLWVACNRAHRIFVIDTATGSVSREFACSGFPFRMRFSPDGRTVAVSLPAAGSIALFQASDPDKMQSVSVVEKDAPGKPAAPTSIAFTPDGNALAAVCDAGQTQTLVRIDLTERKVTHRWQTDQTLDALAAATTSAQTKD
jgi:hypothetical protein